MEIDKKVSNYKQQYYEKNKIRILRNFEVYYPKIKDKLQKNYYENIKTQKFYCYICQCEMINRSLPIHFNTKKHRKNFIFHDERIDDYLKNIKELVSSFKCIKIVN
jgi:hypothetical protein